MRPKIAVTLGDPAGIGPEIVVKALDSFDRSESFDVIVVGEETVFSRALRDAGVSDDYSRVGKSFDGFHEGESKVFVNLDNLDGEVTSGDVDAEAGRASGEFIEFGVELCKRGIADAISTAPINKQSFSAGGFDWPGHTEFLADLTDTKHFEMSFFAGKLCVVLLSRHLPIREAIENVSTESVSKLIRFTDESLGSLIGKRPRIAVAGLNPHASDGGLFGSDEKEKILPAVEETRAAGVWVSGPHSPDTIFLRGYNGEFDAVIALYHDQATIPVKCLSFGKAVNVTLGLPIIRTSVDHGTAYEIAGKNQADSGSMKAAIKLAVQLARGKEN